MRAALILVVTACGNAGQGEPPIDGAVPVSDDAPVVMIDAPDDAAVTVETCFPVDPSKPHPDYGQFHPTVNAQCTGTNHQAIAGVERVVFLGDSITTGTPPTSPNDFYRTLVGNQMRQVFGPSIDIKDCSAWGAHDTDLPGQIEDCFGDVEIRKTLVVMTNGGNDMASIAKDADGDTADQTMAKVDQSLQALENAVTWIRDPAHLPNGSYIVFSNIYEFTDATGDLASCPAAVLSGFDTTAAPQMTPAYVHVAEQYMRIAVDHQVDLVFALENFCGHGYHSDDPASPCYRGPGTERWFDLTCVHPNPHGHAALAGLFETTIAL